MYKKNIYHKTNKLVNMFQLSVMISVCALELFKGEMFNASMIFLMILLAGLPVSIFIKKKIFIEQTIYVILTSISFILFIILATNDTFEILKFIPVMLVIALSSLYRSYKPVIYASILGFFILNYTGIKLIESFSEKNDVFDLNVALLAFSALMFIQVKNFNRIEKEMENKNNEIVSKNNKIELHLEKTENSIRSMNLFGHNLYKTISATKEDSEEIAHSYQNLNSLMQTHVDKTKEAKKQLTYIHQETDKIKDVGGEMNVNANFTYRTTYDAVLKFETFSERLKEAIQQNELVVPLMDELNERIFEIETIVSTIDKIASQTNILALNANIEATKISSGSKGFSVVANEFKVLAESTFGLTKEIKSAITVINNKTKETTEAVSMSDHALKLSKNEIDGLRNAFDDIQIKSKNTYEKSETMNGSLVNIATTIHQLVTEYEEMSMLMNEQYNENNHIYEKVNKQNNQIQNMSRNFKELEQKLLELQE